MKKRFLFTAYEVSGNCGKNTDFNSTIPLLSTVLRLKSIFSYLFGNLFLWAYNNIRKASTSFLFFKEDTSFIAGIKKYLNMIFRAYTQSHGK